MKKITALIMSLLIVFTMIPIYSFAAAAASFTGPTTVRAGDTVSVAFKVSGGNLSGYSGTLKYDSSVLTLQSVSSNAGSSWSFTRNGNNIVAYDTTGNTAPATALFTATFKVNSGVATGTAVETSFSGDFSMDGTESELSATYKSTIAAPLSSDATLSSLTVGNAKLSPAFSPNKTEYSCGTVDFNVSKLSISAVANDSGSKVSIDGSNLSVGKNTVKITVTASNGAKKTYTISVTREQDPNYVASTNTKLSGITVSAGQLSPEFAADVTEYVVYVPYEIAVFSISASAADPLAQGAEGVEEAQLKVGLNKLEVKCIAEDGSEGVYKINVVRMSEYDGINSIALPNGDELTTEAETTEPADNQSDDMQKGGISPVILSVLCAVCLLLGFAIGALLMRSKEDTPDVSDDDDDDDDYILPPDYRPNYEHYINATEDDYLDE